LPQFKAAVETELFTLVLDDAAQAQLRFAMPADARLSVRAVADTARFIALLERAIDGEVSLGIQLGEATTPLARLRSVNANLNHAWRALLAGGLVAEALVLAGGYDVAEFSATALEFEQLAPSNGIPASIARYVGRKEAVPN
jgi:hypothetical protein